MKLVITIIISCLSCLLSTTALSAWYDTNTQGTAPDWSYRVPVELPANTAINQTVKVDVDFNALLTGLGASGTLDVNSPRVVRPNDALASAQEFTDNIYNGVLDAANNNRGQIKFIVDDNGVGPYYLYFDVTSNGSKPANSQPTINGDFENSLGSTPTNWTIASTNAAGSQHNDVQTTAFGNTYSSSLTCSDGAINNVNNSPHNNGSAATTTGQQWYLLGYRNNCEDGSGNEDVRVSRQFQVPSSNAGVFEFYFQMQGYDDVNYDYMEVRVNNALINHTLLGINNTALSVSAAKLGLASTYSATIKDAGWQRAQLALSAYAGQTITVSIAARFATDNAYRTWIKLDDVVWSLQQGTLGTAEAFTPIEPEISVKKTKVTIADPLNGTNLPKAIPGATIEYILEPTNTGAGSADANSIALTDAIPAGTTLLVTDIAATGSGPASFTDGSPSSGLSYNFTQLNDLSDNLAFSADGGGTFDYSPVANGDGVDVNVTHIQIRTQGIFKASSPLGDPSFKVRFRVKLN